MSAERLLKVLVSPIMSEKSTQAADRQRRYVFEVMKDANKLEIGKAVADLFKVEVESVQAATAHGKIKRFGRKLGKRADWKKAYVKLKPGHEIQLGTGA